MSVSYPGLPGAPGIGIGVIALYRPGNFAPQGDAAADDPDAEWRAFLEAHSRVDADLEQLGQNPNSFVAEIFAAHRAILQDKTLLDSVHQSIVEQGASAITAVHQVTAHLADLFRSLDDEYFAGRAVDVLDLGQRLLAHLGASLAQTQLAALPPKTILIASDLTPSDLAQLPAGHVAGIALAESTPTAHSAILARSQDIPLVCALGPDILQVQPGLPAIIDGNRGQIWIEPEPLVVRLYHEAHQLWLERQSLASVQAHEPAATRDGVYVSVCANANSPQEVAQSAAVGADGIGLLRTEYLFRSRASPPSGDEQAEIYAGFAAQVTGQLTVRALDAGGDKPVDYIVHHREDNPFLGLRGIRLLLEQPDLLVTQYRSLQIAAACPATTAQVRFLLPMISTVEEVIAVRTLLNNRASAPALPLGIMIEVPSAALVAPQLVPLVDFFSIGTNDLAQYVLASDRTNRAVARLADPLHPAVLHLIWLTCRAAQAAGKPVSLCGEIGGDPEAVPLLLGLGVTELSVPLPAVSLVKQIIRQWEMARCRRLAEEALACPHAQAVRDLLAAGP
jgi:phosphocarrier protein FPr